MRYTPFVPSASTTLAPNSLVEEQVHARQPLLPVLPSLQRDHHLRILQLRQNLHLRHAKPPRDAGARLAEEAVWLFLQTQQHRRGRAWCTKGYPPHT